MIISYAFGIIEFDFCVNALLLDALVDNNNK
jgi:hypothetical protein